MLLFKDVKVWATLLALLMLIMVYIKVKNFKIEIRTMVLIALVLALTFIMHSIVLYRFPQGGAITCCGMLPIILLALIYGMEVGFLAGFMFGILNLMQNPFIVHPLQVLFDYPLPYMALGLAGYFPKHFYVGTTIAVLARLSCHFISGVIFFSEYAPKGVSPYWYSLYFNLAYLGIEYLLCLAALKFIPVRSIQSFVVKKMKSCI